MALWILMAPRWQEPFGSAAACSSEVAAWQSRAQEGARWAVGQYQRAMQQKDEAVTTFWRKAVHRAAEEAERARGARCVEVKS